MLKVFEAVLVLFCAVNVDIASASNQSSKASSMRSEVMSPRALKSVKMTSLMRREESTISETIEGCSARRVSEL